MSRDQFDSACARRSTRWGAAVGLALASFAVAAVSSAPPAAAMTITPIFDASITALPNAATIEGAFLTAARDYASSFTSPATVYIGVSWGKVGSYALPSGALGASLDPLYGYFSYSQVRGYLANAAARNPSDTSLVSMVNNLPVAAPSGPTRYVIPAAEMKALGLISASAAYYDGYVGFAGSSATGYDYNPTDGVAAGRYDFQAVAAHEIAEVLGRISGLSGTNPTYRTLFDLMRYAAPGSLGFSYGAAAYFSIDGGRTNRGNFNNSQSGGDRGDWLTLASSRDVSDAFIYPGINLNITAADLTALDALGWAGVNLGNSGASPSAIAFNLVEGTLDPIAEPGTLGALASGLLAFVMLRRRTGVAGRVRT